MKILKQEKIFSGKILTLYKKIVQNSDKTLWERESVSYGSNAVTILGEYKGNIVFVSQFRPAVNDILLELPAGRIEKGENAFVCAKREMEEETSLIPINLELLVEIYPSPGFMDEKISIFYANEFKEGKTNFDPGEELKSLFIPPKEINSCIFLNKIKDAKTLIGLLLWKERIYGKK
jgi:ADP-ribose pyrophosphatase